MSGTSPFVPYLPFKVEGNPLGKQDYVLNFET